MTIVQRKHTPSSRALAKAGALAASLALVLLGGGIASAQSLTVLPVSITMQPGQLATTMTVINQGTDPTTVQVRVVSWQQASGLDKLVPSDSVVISPPIVTIAPGATQTVRVVLRKPEQGTEGTYRVLLDEIPSVAAAPGTVRIALSLSIPVFAEPAARVGPNVTFHVEKSAGHAMLVASNTGSSHETMREIGLTTSTGSVIGLTSEGTPYILAGATRQWKISDQGAALLVSGTPLHLTARAGSGAIAREVPVVASTSQLTVKQP